MLMTPSGCPLMSPVLAVLDIVRAPALLCRGLKSVAITPVLVIWILIHPPLTFLTVSGYFSRNLRQYLSYLRQIIDQQKLNYGKSAVVKCKGWVCSRTTNNNISCKRSRLSNPTSSSNGGSASILNRRGIINGFWLIIIALPQTCLFGEERD